MQTLEWSRHHHASHDVLQPPLVAIRHIHQFINNMFVIVLQSATNSIGQQFLDYATIKVLTAWTD